MYIETGVNVIVLTILRRLFRSACLSLPRSTAVSKSHIWSVETKLPGVCRCVCGIWDTFEYYIPDQLVADFNLLEIASIAYIYSPTKETVHDKNGIFFQPWQIAHWNKLSMKARVIFQMRSQTWNLQKNILCILGSCWKLTCKYLSHKISIACVPLLHWSLLSIFTSWSQWHMCESLQGWHSRPTQDL